MSRRQKNKFRPEFERDYQFYFDNKNNFSFSGIDIKDKYLIQFPGELEKIIQDDDCKDIKIPFDIPYAATGVSAKECFYKIDSEGKRLPCSQPALLLEILNCKAAINLQIKIWAESRADYTLSIIEMQEYLEFYKAPDWVLKAVENSKNKILKDLYKEKLYLKSNYHFLTCALHMSEVLEEINKN